MSRIAGINGSVILYSLWSGYRERDNTKKFMDALRLLGIGEEYLHTSGHAPRETLQRLVDIIRPKLLFPIHTLTPEQYDGFGVPVQRLDDGQEWEL